MDNRPQESLAVGDGAGRLGVFDIHALYFRPLSRHLAPLSPSLCYTLPRTDGMLFANASQPLTRGLEVANTPQNH